MPILALLLQSALWTQSVGAGFAAPAYAEGKLLLFHRVGNQETLDALDPASGKRIWRFQYPTNYRDDFGFDEGPRAAPVAAGGRVFTYGAEGVLNAVDLATGKKIWSIEAMSRYGVAKGFFGAAGSPVLWNNTVMVNAGGRAGAGIVAFDAASGKELWKATNDEASYSTGVVATILGKPRALFFTRNGLVCLDPSNGKVDFQMRWRSRSNASVNAAAPVVDGDEVFLSSSYGTGAILLKAQPGEWKTIWSGDDSMSNHYATSVKVGPYLYGFHGRQEMGQEFRCVEWATGKVVWSKVGFGAGTVLLNSGQLVITREDGEIWTVRPDPKAMNIVSKRKALPGTVRAYPAVFDGKICVRNESTLACLAL